jgi:hypothetical protein
MNVTIHPEMDAAGESVMTVKTESIRHEDQRTFGADVRQEEGSADPHDPMPEQSQSVGLCGSICICTCIVCVSGLQEACRIVMAKCHIGEQDLDQGHGRLSTLPVASA